MTAGIWLLSCGILILTCADLAFVHFDFDVNLEDWLLWATDHNIPSELLAFIRFRPNLLHDFDPKRNEKAFPTPRSWEFVGRILKSNKAEHLEHHLIAGAVGEGAATELKGYLQVWRDLPDIKDLLTAPETTNIPNDPATLFAVCELLAHHADATTFPTIIKYAQRLSSEFNVLLIRSCVTHDKTLVQTSEFHDWANKHAEVLV